MTDLPADWLTALPGANDLGEIFLTHFDALVRQSRAELATHPVLGPRLAAATPEQLEVSVASTKARVAQAFAGDWNAYEKALREDGGMYASLGLSFEDWFGIATSLVRPVASLLFERLAAEPARMLLAFEAMQQFQTRAFSAIGSAFIATAERHVQSRELALERRAKQLHRWEILFERIGYGVCIADDSAEHILQCNQAFLTQYGLEAHDPTRSLGSLFEPEEWQRIRTEIGPVARATGFGRCECTHRRADGTTFPGVIEVVRIPEVDSEPAWAVSLHDWTERRELEALQARSTALEAESRNANEASRLKSEFLANMSHELRTPLNSILGFSELLRDGEVGVLSEQQREFVGDIYTSGRHLLHLINDVLDLSKIEAGRLELHPQDHSLEQLSHEVEGVIHDLATDKRVTVDVTVEPSIDRVRLDGARLKQVLYNYLANAIKFSPAHARVSLSFQADVPGRFRVEVTDVGPGISEANQGRLFTQFEQLDPGRGKSHGGTGLGLALTRRLVEAQGGTVGVRSQVGVGSTFFAVLPLRATTDTRLPRSPRPSLALSGTPHVPMLIVDDDETSARLMATALAQLGVRLDVASSAAEALHYLAERQPSAIILDLVMPDLDGFGFLRELRAHDEWSDIPVLVWTTRDLTSAERDLLLSRAHAVLGKDGSGTAALADAVRTHLPNVVPTRSR